MDCMDYLPKPDERLSPFDVVVIIKLAVTVICSWSSQSYQSKTIQRANDNNKVKYTKVL